MTSERLREVLDEHLEHARDLGAEFPAVEALGRAICGAGATGDLRAITNPIWAERL